MKEIFQTISGPADWLLPLRTLWQPPAAGLDGPCPVCGRPMSPGRLVAATGEQFCIRHRDRPRCWSCAMPANSGLRTELPLCGRCAITAVRSQADVKRVLPPIAQQIRSLGIRNRTPVQVRVVERAKLTAAAKYVGTGCLLGLTMSRGTDVVQLMILRDLPIVKFGSTVAHESMHAYLAQHRYPNLPPAVVEGICQLLAFAWVRRQAGVLATLELREIEENPDPVYGDGFRLVKSAVARTGVRDLLEYVRVNHELP